nr:unnamed protein product [Callosobruchus chinensis]
MVKAVRLANWWHIPCFAHSLNLIVQSGLLEIAELLTNIKSIVEFLEHSSSATEKLQNMQKRMGFEVLKLKQDCPTRWNSTFDMLNRLRKMKEPLQSTLGILNNSALPQLKTEDWYMVEKCCDILSIFNEITIEVSSEKNVTLPKIAIISKNLINYCTRLKSENFESQFIINMVSKLYDEVVTRYKKKYRNIPIIWEATLLDPRFKQHGFHEADILRQTKENLISKCSKVRVERREEDAKKKNEITEPVASTSSDQTPSSFKPSSIWAEFDSEVEKLVDRCDNPRAASIVELDKFLQMSFLSRHGDPLLWWKENKFLFPHLYEIMRRRLCIPATSFPCERSFSKNGQIITEKRCRLSSAKTSKLVFLNYNMQ